MVAAIIAGLSSLLGAIGIEFGKIFTVETAKFIAYRAFTLFIVFVCIPIVLYNVASDLILDLMNYAVGSVGDLTSSPLVIQLTGMGGWIGTKIGIQNCLSVYMTAISTRFAISFIPFLR